MFYYQYTCHLEFLPGRYFFLGQSKKTEHCFDEVTLRPLKYTFRVKGPVCNICNDLLA